MHGSQGSEFPILEHGPLHEEQRVALIGEPVTFGVSFKVTSKLITSKYTGLHSNIKVVDICQDKEQVSEAMTELFGHP